MDQHTREGPATWECVLLHQGNGLPGMSGQIAVAFVVVAFVLEAGVASDPAAMALEVTSRSVMSTRVKPALENGLCGRPGVNAQQLVVLAGATGRPAAKRVEKVSGSECGNATVAANAEATNTKNNRASCAHATDYKWLLKRKKRLRRVLP
ncbi:hypothetical protein ANCCEY_12457 [Ancylostoma ceylanicum]|uniref:Uncharacterized protein n=1 Tax=Ancylostoma ceylanicum TaxID=53326 RepID=A0A0D6L992_9BILA|nr:hypothetical protein ANCCEY_12457 [Ancylostoma ceylanicum]